MERLLQVGRNAAALFTIRIYAHRDSPNIERIADLAAAALLAFPHGDDPEPGLMRHSSLDQLFELLYDNEATVGWERIANLEWAYLPAFGYDAQPRMLNRLLASNPEFFVEAVTAAFRTESRDEEAPEVSSEDEQRARNAYRLLDGWSTPPGSQDDGSIAAPTLTDWLARATTLLTGADRLKLGRQMIGRVLARAPSDPDHVWPSQAVREVIEAERSDDIELGFYLAVINGRGFVGRGLDEGGDQERALAAQYREKANAYADKWHRTAALLGRLADNYEQDARRADESSERFRQGLDR